MEAEIPVAKNERERAKLAGDMSLICHKYLHDSARAVATAQLALHIDPSNADALRVLGYTAHAEKRYVEAAKRFEPRARSTGACWTPRKRARSPSCTSTRLSRSGSADKALNQVGGLMKWFEDDASALLRIAEVAAEHGSAEQTLWLCEAPARRHALHALTQGGERSRAPKR